MESNRMIRLDKYLSDCGLGTRKEVKKIIKEEIVTVNDERIVSPSFLLVRQKVMKIMY